MAIPIEELEKLDCAARKIRQGEHMHEVVVTFDDGTVETIADPGRIAVWEYAVLATHQKYTALAEQELGHA